MLDMISVKCIRLKLILVFINDYKLTYLLHIIINLNVL